MLGRAGRQGLDDTGVAVIMTSREDQDYYADVSLNAEIVESKLQTHLVEGIYFLVIFILAFGCPISLLFFFNLQLFVQRLHRR